MRENVIRLFVLFTIGAIMAALLSQFAAVAAGFKTLDSVWSWALHNAYGDAPPRAYTSGKLVDDHQHD